MAEKQSKELNDLGVIENAELKRKAKEEPPQVKKAKKTNRGGKGSVERSRTKWE